MTNEEMERALEFLVKSQAAFEARQAAFDVQQKQTAEQIAETGRQLQIYAETQSEFIQIVTASITRLAEAQANAERMIAESRAECDARIAESSARLDEKVADTNARLDRLAAMLERNFGGGGNGAS